MPVVKGDNSLFFATALDNSGLRRGSLDAVGIIQGLSRKIASINPFAALAVGAVAAFGVISAQAYNMSRNFEQAMKEVETISAATQKNFKGISQEVFNLTKITPDGPEKLAKAYYQIVSAGFDGAKGLKLLETASKAAVAGVTDTETAADGITTVLNAFRIEAEESNRVADVLFKTVQLGKTTFSELAANISTVAPIAAASGIDFEQIAAAIASLTKQGVPTAQAMTQIRSAIIGANEALGDGWSNALTLQEAFQKLFEEAGGSQTKLQGLVGRVEAVSAILGIAGDNAQGAAKDLEAMGNAAGASTDAFERMSKSNVNQIEILKNRIRATTKGIGDAVLSMSNSIAGGLNDLLDGNRSLVDSYREHQKQVNDLTFEYRSHQTSLERKKEILEELEKISPAIVSGLNKEGDEYEDLSKNIKTYNELLGSRIRLEKQLTELQDLEQAKDSLKESVVDLEVRAREIVKNINNAFLAGRIELDDAVKDKFQQTLDEDLGSNIEKIKALNDLLLNELGVEGDFTFDFIIKDFNISAAEKALNLLNGRIDETSGKISKVQNDINERLLAEIEVDESKKNFVLDLLDAYQNLSKVSQEIGVDVELIDDKKIKESIQNIKLAEAEVTKINNITKEQYLANKDILKEALNSENKLIAEAAKKRRDLFEFKPNPNGGDDDRSAIEKFKDSLDERKKEFEEYNLAIIKNDDDLAKKLKEKYQLKEKDYVAFLRSLYSETEDVYKKIQILRELDVQGVDLERPIAQKVSEIEAQGVVELKLEVDISSVDAIEQIISRLQSQFNSLQDNKAQEKKAIAERIKYWKERLDLAKKYLEGEKGEEEDFYNFLRTSSKKALIERKKELKDELKALKDNLEQGSDEYKKLQDQIKKINEETDRDLSTIASNFADSFSQLSDLFAKFGDEDTAQLLDQLSGVASGISEIAKGDPASIIKGSLQVLNSAITVEIVSDTAKFEAAIKKLEKAIEQLDYVISQSIGRDKISNRLEAIEDLKDLEKQADLARDAELKARKEVKLFGIRIGKKGAGSGTDPEKLEELEQKAEDARRKAEELRQQLDELYTGTTQKTLVDNIIDGLREGKKSVKDFADDFKKTIQDAMLQAFQIKYLEGELDKFFEAFSLAGSDSNYTAAEINSLRNLYETIITGAQDDIDAINNILEQTGIGKLGDPSTDPNTPLTGAIRREITEETGSELLGLFRGQYDLTKQHFENSVKQLGSIDNIAQLSQEIANNTFETVEQLKLAVFNLVKIADNTEKQYLLELG